MLNVNANFHVGHCSNRKIPNLKTVSALSIHVPPVTYLFASLGDYLRWWIFVNNETLFVKLSVIECFHRNTYFYLFGSTIVE